MKLPKFVFTRNGEIKRVADIKELETTTAISGDEHINQFIAKRRGEEKTFFQYHYIFSDGTNELMEYCIDLNLTTVKAWYRRLALRIFNQLKVTR